MKNKNYITAGILLLLVLVMCFVAGRDFLAMRKPDKIYPSSALTKTLTLSEYNQKLKGTNGDTPVYVFDSNVPGATFLLLGGTHPNEPAGFMTALLITENIMVKTGKVIIIPQACLSGFTCTDPLEGYPEFFHLKTKSGIRDFRFGSRVSNPLDQWPDPLVYSHFPSGQQLSGYETRNLNRSYPGRENGTFTEKVGYAIMELIKKEKVDIAVDLHEAAPEIPIINAIIGHEKGRDLAAAAILNLEIEGLQYALEISPQNFHGLSHREWGDATSVYPFLMETSNPIQGRLRGKTDESLIINGIDPLYKRAQETGKFRITYNPEGQPLSLRVARHLTALRTLIDVFNEQFPDKKLIYENLPDYNQVLNGGIGNYLQ